MAYKSKKIKKQRRTTRRKQRGGNGSGNIEKIVHQIWFGGGHPKYRDDLFKINKSICETFGYTYKLWEETDRTEANFPITYKYQQKCIAIGDESGQNRLAQVADLARIELIFRYGGIYIDSIFEISDAFLKAINALSKQNKYQFIGTNEDPCYFDCEGYEKNKYLSNSFFAGPKGSIIFGRLLEPDRLESIDYESQYINRTTGPYYIRSVITDEDIESDILYLFTSATMYPFNVNETPYQPKRPNKCLYGSMENDDGEEIENNANGSENFIKIKDGQYLLKNCVKVLRKKNKELLAVYHSGLGGTWSF